MLAICNCKRMPGQTQRLLSVFETLDIEPYKKAVLEDRYLTVLRNFQYRANLYSFMFFTSRITVTVGSILVPAFLSIQGNPIRDNLYLAAWMISILVTVCNGFVTLFKIDKKYFFIHMTLEMLHSEGWQYVGLTGRYAPKDPPVPPTHENQFVVFFHMAEKIKLRQVEEEYWKFTDTSATGNAAANHPTDYIQTPVTQQGPLASLPPEQKNVIEGWLTAMSKKSVAGLAPRNQTMLTQYESFRRPHHTHHTHKHRVHDNKDETTVDEEASPTRIRRTSSNASMPVHPYMPSDATSRATVVPEPQQSVLFTPSTKGIEENTEITVSETLPNRTNEWVRTET